MTLESNPGRYRYVLTRPCLESGSVAVLKYLERALPTSGTVTLIGDGGEEINLNADPKTNRLYGLTDYFAKHRLQPNDVLFLTLLSERRFSLERVVRVREARGAESRVRPEPPPKPERIVIEENKYIREVRTREATVLPYSKGLMYPLGTVEKNETNLTPEVRKSKPAQEARSTLKHVIARDRDQRAAEDNTKTERQELKVTTTNSIMAAAQTKTESLPKPEVPVIPVVELHSSDALPISFSNLERTRATFIALGYTVDVIGQGLLLQARLGRRSYQVALAVSNDPNEISAVFKIGHEKSAKYFALAAAANQLNTIIATFNTTTKNNTTNITQVEFEALDQLSGLTFMSPIGPLDLEAYWNAGHLDASVIESLESSINSSINARGAFSFVTLSLARFSAPSVVSIKDVMLGTQSTGIGSGSVTETLELLTKAPFMLLSSLGGGEYYLRRPLSAGLESLSEYATGLRSRLRVTTNVATHVAARADRELIETR